MVTVLYCQFNLTGNRLEHPENPESYICLSEEAANLLPPKHRRRGINGCADSCLNKYFVFVDHLLSASEYETYWELDCIHCINKNCIKNTALEYFIQQINRVTIHELIHICTPQRLKRGSKKHEDQTDALTRLICPMGCDSIIYEEAEI